MYVSKTRKRRQMRSRSGCGRRLITVSRRFARARAWSSGDSSSSARRPRSSSGPRPSRSRASTATTTARSTPASGCSERSSFPARPGHQGIDRTRPGHQGRPAARARLRMYIVGSLTPLTHMNKVITYIHSLSRDGSTFAALADEIVFHLQVGLAGSRVEACLVGSGNVVDE